jgi:predicted Rossmann-fold nucleotide-binding protein
MSLVDVKRRAESGAHGRRRVVAVIGSGRTADPGCAGLGRLIAALGCDLLTGGGGGVMEAVSRAFFETSPRKGIVIGIIPATVEPLQALEDREAAPIDYELSPGYPNRWVELAIYTHLPDSGSQGTLRSSRNHINVLSADAIVALPGQEGTESEIWLALQYGVPVIGYGTHKAPAARKRHGAGPSRGSAVGGDRGEGRPPHGIALAQSLDEVRYFLSSSASR